MEHALRDAPEPAVGSRLVGVLLQHAQVRREALIGHPGLFGEHRQRAHPDSVREVPPEHERRGVLERLASGLDQRGERSAAGDVREDAVAGPHVLKGAAPLAVERKGLGTDECRQRVGGNGPEPVGHDERGYAASGASGRSERRPPCARTPRARNGILLPAGRCNANFIGDRALPRLLPGSCLFSPSPACLGPRFKPSPSSPSASSPATPATPRSRSSPRASSRRPSSTKASGPSSRWKARRAAMARPQASASGFRKGRTT